MKRFILAAILGSAILFLVLAPQVRADGTDTFTYEGADAKGNSVTVSWSLPSSPSPSGEVSGWYFDFLNDVTVTYTVGSTTKTDSNTTIYFMNRNAPDFYGGGHGGFELVENATPWTVLYAQYFTTPGVSLFSGTDSQPTCLPGTYNLTSVANNLTQTPGTLTISRPEPSVLLLLLTGLLAAAVVLGLKRTAA